MATIARVRTSLLGLAGGTGLSTCYFAGPGDVDASIALEGAKRVRAFWNSMAALMGTGIQAQVQPQVDALDPATGQLDDSFGVTAQTVVTGSATGDYLPPSNQLLVQQHTGAVVAGRRVNGRINVPGLTETNSGGGGAPSTTATAAAATAGALLNTLILTACSNVVWHRPKNGSGGSAVLVTSYTGSPKFAVLRSRRD